MTGPSWRAWARIAGHELPTTTVTLGRALVGPWPLSEKPPEAPTGLRANIEGAVHINMHPPEMKVASECWVIVQGISANGYDEAVGQFMHRDIPPIVAALTAGRPGHPYRVQLVGADDGNEPYVYSAPLGIANFSPVTNLAADRLKEVKDRLATIEGDEHLRLAAELFDRGIRYTDMMAGKSTEASAILAYHQVLEACSRIVAFTPGPDHEDKQAALVRQLTAQLQNRTKTNKLVAEIRKFGNALDRLDNRSLSERIENAAKEFSLDQDWFPKAKALAKRRNSRIGHARSLHSDNGISLGLAEDTGDTDLAHEVASTMLDHAIRYVSNAERD